MSAESGVDLVGFSGKMAQNKIIEAFIDSAEYADESNEAWDEMVAEYEQSDEFKGALNEALDVTACTLNE